MPDTADPSEMEVSGNMSDSDNEYDDNDGLIKDEDDKMADQNAASDGVDANGEPKKKYDPKDPLRPRRKKARRACFACQRAHLTCGDERPCQRCIKRGLAEACQDGVRKKAKYLHDAPAEALRPVLGPNYDPTAPAILPNGRHRHHSNSGSEVSTVGTFFSQPSSQFPVFSSQQPSLGPLSEPMQFGGQQSPVSPTFQGPANPLVAMGLNHQVSSPMSGFAPALLDPATYLNFNIEGLNFGSQYGAMEFGMLGHMSSGAAETPPRDPSLPQAENGEMYGATGVYGNGLGQFDKPTYDNNLMNDYLGLGPSPNGIYPQGNLQHGLPHAYAIAAGPTSLQSPSTENNSPQPTHHGLDASPTVPTYGSSMGAPGSQQISLPRPKPRTPALARLGQQSVLGKRTRDPSYIYETVKEPFPYVQSFHRVIKMLKARFSKEKVTRIAKAMGAIRPAFISCTKTLNRADLVFMEKSFQRALFEYEEFMHQCSSPALVCRRTGEVAGVNKEFTALTGWTKDVLLGKEANFNINMGAMVSSSDSSTSKPGTTPVLNSLDMARPAEGQQQPVFLFELLDDESVIDFYEDYAQLAFNNSRGKVVKKCRLLKYRTKESLEGGGDAQDPGPQKDFRSSILSNRVAKIDGEHGISRLEKDGKLECTYTWVIKRDTFDIPMIIIINFLPSYWKDHNQLAV
ncbi:hypothetical protein QBC39DRAFT_256588 [Podospora conica]|nr:hypothetical protein QBC39DRAFT_256588 [Schizothecium conicum]